jgi:type III pantothenate kinase
LIAPGLSLMRESLARGTHGLNLAGGGSAGSFAQDTVAAIIGGTLQATAGLLERSFHTAERRLSEKPRLLLTGGDAPIIAAELNIPHQLRPDLVLEGLLAIAHDRP